MVAIITGGASGMGKAREFATHGTQAIVIANVQDEKGHRHRHDVIVIILQSCRSLSLSLFWWLVVLIVVGWLILVDGGRLIGLWA